MKLLSRDQILAADDLKREWVPAPEWADGDPESGVYVRALNGLERDAFEAETFRLNGDQLATNRANLRARLCARSCCDDKGERIFTDEDAAALGRKSAAALDRVFAAAQRLSGLRKEDVDRLKKVSDAGPPASSDTGSPPSSAS